MHQADKFHQENGKVLISKTVFCQEMWVIYFICGAYTLYYW